MSVRLPVDLYSADQLSAVILELRDYMGALRNSAVRIKAGKPAAEPPHISALLLGIFHGAGLKPETQKATEALLAELEKIRDKAPIAHITLPDLPSRTLKRQLTVWFRTEISPYIMLTFSVRSDICGGMIMQTGSRLYDFSFRRQVTDNKSRISEVFASV